MKERDTWEGRAYSNTSISGPASAHLGDKNEYGTRYNIQQAQFNFYNAGTNLPAYPQASFDHEFVSHNTRAGKGLAILTFDDGLHDGLACLYMVKEFMGRVAAVHGSSETLKPCEFFNMIAGGSGHGALIAILLGRLELDIDTAIEQYRSILSQSVTGPAQDAVTPHEVSVDSSRRVFDSEAVTQCVGDILKRSGKAFDEPMLTGRAVSCRTFVISESEELERRSIFRSYMKLDGGFVESHSESIVDVLRRATSPFMTQSNEAGGNQGRFASHQDADRVGRIAFDAWSEACATILDVGQNLEHHVDIFLSIGSSLPDLSQTAEFVSAASPNLVKAPSAVMDSFTRLEFQGRYLRVCLPPIFPHQARCEAIESAELQTLISSRFDDPVLLDKIEVGVKIAADHQVPAGFSLLKTPYQALEGYNSQLDRSPILYHRTMPGLPIGDAVILEFGAHAPGYSATKFSHLGVRH